MKNVRKILGWGKLKETDWLGDLGIDGRIILRWMIMKKIGLTHDTV
jgi:hypothetical protein